MALPSGCIKVWQLPFFPYGQGQCVLPPHLDIFASHISFFGAFINDPKKINPEKKWVDVFATFKPLGAGSWEWKSSHPPTSQTGRVNPELGPVGVWVYHPISWHNLFHLQPDRWNQCPGGPVWMMRQKSWDFWAELFFWDANFLLGPSKMALNLCFTELIFTLRTGSYRRYFTPISTWWQGHLVEKTQENTDLLTADTFRKTMFNRKWHRIVVVETRGCCVQKSDSRKQKIVVVAVVLLRIVWLLGDHTIWRGPLTCNTRF